MTVSISMTVNGKRVEGECEDRTLLVQYLRDQLGLIGSAAETEELARSIEDSGEVVIVPALAGLGAPHWKPDARGVISGLSFASGRAQIARAALGEPNGKLSSARELRFGTHGSKSVVLQGEKAGAYYDHENGPGGGPVELVRDAVESGRAAAEEARTDLEAKLERSKAAAKAGIAAAREAAVDGKSSKEEDVGE